MSRKTPLRKVLFISLVILLSTSQTGTVSAGINVWTSIGPDGRTIYALAIDPATPTTLYAGTDGYGVFKSTNGGAQWSAANTGLTATDVTALAIDPVTPATLYAVTYGGGVFKSTNGGGNWSAVNIGLTATDVTALAIDSTTPTTLYAGTGNYGVFKSTNGGGDWSATGLTNTGVSALVIDLATPTTLYAGGYGGMFKSTNGGAQWSPTGLTNCHIDALAIDPVTPTTLYAGISTVVPIFDNGYVFKSTNGGAQWSPTGLTNFYVDALAIDPATPTTLYAGSSLYGDGVFKSTNGGAQWSAINTGLTSTRINALAIDPAKPTTLYAGTYGGVFAMQQLIYQAYLPIAANPVQAPDLVVDRIIAAGSEIQIVIKNLGPTPVTDEFWVDAYINPNPPPTQVNQTWNQVGQQGVVWGLTSDDLPLAAGSEITLTVSPAGGDDYWPSFSVITWPLPAGTAIYAQVDSANTTTNYGGVLETHEITGGPYNNITGPIYSTAATADNRPVPQSAIVGGDPAHLPTRP